MEEARDDTGIDALDLSGGEEYDVYRMKLLKIRFNPIWDGESPRRFIYFVDESEVFGMDVKKEEFMNILLSHDTYDKEFSVIPIQGAAANKCCVIVTTRKEDYASLISTVDAYRMEPLLYDESWSLFAKFAFGNQIPSSYPELESIGRRIVNGCDGVPSTVVLVLMRLSRCSIKRRTLVSLLDISSDWRITLFLNSLTWSLLKMRLRPDWKKKIFIDELVLEWGGAIVDPEKDEDVIEKLQPSSFLGKLHINLYFGDMKAMACPHVHPTKAMAVSREHAAKAMDDQAQKSDMELFDCR
nr:putative disease resistance rpp13-like protein 1 [Quercus suber]